MLPAAAVEAPDTVNGSQVSYGVVFQIPRCRFPKMSKMSKMWSNREVSKR